MKTPSRRNLLKSLMAGGVIAGTATRLTAVASATVGTNMRARLACSDIASCFDIRSLSCAACRHDCHVAEE